VPVLLSAVPAWPDRAGTAFLRCLAAGSLALLLSCSTAGPQPDTKTVSYDGMVAEYRDATVRMSLPSGATWPERPVPRQPDARYERGLGTTEAETHWFCAWQREWLDQRERDEARARTALDTMETVRDTQMYRVAYDDTVRSTVDNQLRAARAGDPEPVSRDVSLNCGKAQP
jgi:hypothetical protein